MRTLLVAVALLAVCASGFAQTADVKPGDWAYEAVTELASKGLVLGYPDGNFLGNRALSRYEMATIVKRVLDEMDRRIQEAKNEVVETNKANTTSPAPAAIKGASAEDVTKIAKLVDEYKVELTVIGADLKKFKEDLEGVKSGLADLRVDVDQTKKDVLANAPTVTMANKGSKLKIDGRIYAGVSETQDDGATPRSTYGIPDAKLRFTATPRKNLTIVNRLSFTQGTTITVGIDYFYLDYSGFPNATSALRLGQRKINVGQETWTDNPVENILISNSASHVSGYGIGAAFTGTLGAAKTAPVYEVGVVNGARGVTTRTSGTQFNAKLGVPLPGNLFLSGSYFRSGELAAAELSGISVAELNAAPTGATGWKRSLWEADLRYNYGPKGLQNAIPSGSLPKLMLGVTYGQFNDDAAGAADRDGNYWFVEGMLSLTPKLYLAGRYSTVSLDNNALAKLTKSPVDVNEFKRTSIGLGYRLTELTDIKAEYSINDASGGTSDPGLNEWNAGFASKF